MHLTAACDRPEPVALRTPGEPDLLDELRVAIRTSGKSGRSAFREVGVDHSVLSRVASGQQANFGLTTCVKIAQRYPELRRAAASYLARRYDRATLSLLAEAYEIQRTLAS